jgi:murein L,D-transpeptidase YafK
MAFNIIKKMIQVFPHLFVPICLTLVILTTSASGGSSGSGTRLVIKKGPQTLEVFKKGRLVKKYRVCLGVSPYGHKTITGDQKTPEGDYFICYKSRKSKYDLFMGLSYPGVADAKAGFEKGLITKGQMESIINRVRAGRKPPWNTKLGGWVGIHGYPTKLQNKIWTVLYYPKPHNWTDGCIAMWSDEIEELYEMTPIGSKVRIAPGPPPEPSILFKPELDLQKIIKGKQENPSGFAGMKAPLFLREIRNGPAKP